MNHQAKEGQRTRRRMLDYIAGYQQEHGWAPTVREIGSAVGLASPSSVQRHLMTLHDQGELVLGGGPRMIRLRGTINLRADDQPVGRHPLVDPLRHAPPPMTTGRVGTDGRLQPGR